MKGKKILKKLKCYNCFWNPIKTRSLNVKCVFTGDYYILNKNSKECRYCGNIVPSHTKECPLCWHSKNFKDTEVLDDEGISKLFECERFVFQKPHSEIIQDLRNDLREDRLSLEGLKGKEKRKRICILSECRPSRRIVDRLKKSEPFISKIKEKLKLTNTEVEELFASVKKAIQKFQQKRFKEFSVRNKRSEIASCFYSVLANSKRHITQRDITHLFGVSPHQIRDYSTFLWNEKSHQREGQKRERTTRKKANWFFKF
jgi:hypothetical protein